MNNKQNKTDNGPPPLVTQMYVAAELIIDNKPLPIWIVQEDNYKMILVFNPKHISSNLLKKNAVCIADTVVQVHRSTGAIRHSLDNCPNYIIPDDHIFSGKIEQLIQAQI